MSEVDDEQQILALHEAGDRALMSADVDILAQIFADDYVQHNESGQAFTKQDVLNNFGTGEIRYPSIISTGRTIRVFGEMAVVNSRFHQQYSGDSKESAGEFLLTDVWVKRDGRWQAVSRHASRPALMIERASAANTHEAE